MTARDDLNKQVQEYLRIAFEGKWVILSIFIVVVSATWLYTMQHDDIYRATVTLRLKPAKDAMSAQAAPGGFEGLGWGGERIIANELLVIQSTALAERVADLMLTEVPGGFVKGDTLPALEAGGKPSTMRKIVRSIGLEDFVISLGFAKVDTSTKLATRDVIAGRVLVQMTAEPIRGVDFVEISAMSTSPIEAAKVANYYVRSYKQRNLETARESVTTTRIFLETQMAAKRDSLRMTEDNVRSYQQSQGFVSLDAETSSLIEQLSSFEAQREQARIELMGSEEILKNLSSQLTDIEPKLAEQLKSGVDPILNSLLVEKADLEQQIARAEYSRKTAIQSRPELEPWLQKQVDDLQQRYSEVTMQIDLITTRLKNSRDATSSPVEYVRELRQKILQQQIDVAAIKARIVSLSGVIREYNRSFDAIPAQSIKFARLERKRQSYYKLYLLLDEKYQESMIDEQMTSGNVEIVDHAKVPGRPVKPNRPMNLILGILVGLGLGFGVAVLLRYLDTTIRNPEDVEKLGFPVLSFIPSFGSTDGKNDRSQTLVTLTAPQSPPSESYRTMRTAIENSLPDHGKRKAVIFTSPAPKEGKSTAIANLAVSAANSGRKVLLVDADLRRPVQHTIFSLEREPGLSNALIGEVPVRECIKKTSVSGLHLIPSGTVPSHPAELLGSSQMEKFVALVRKYYDLVLFDAPPVIAMADTLVLAKYADGITILISADKTKSLGLEKTYEMLESNSAKILGVVVNRFNANKIYYSYYRYYYQNYYYYSMDGEKKSRRQKKKKRSEKNKDTGQVESKA